MKLENKIANAKVRAAAQMERPCPVVPQAPAPVVPPTVTVYPEPSSPLPAAPAGGGGCPPKSPARVAKDEADHNGRRSVKITLMTTPMEHDLIELRAKNANCSLSRYIRQAALSGVMDERRAEDQRVVSLDMIGLLRADLTRCVATLQRRSDKDRELIDIMITLQRALDTINKREEDLSC